MSCRRHICIIVASGSLDEGEEVDVICSNMFFLFVCVLVLGLDPCGTGAAH